MPKSGKINVKPDKENHSNYDVESVKAFENDGDKELNFITKYDPNACSEVWVK